MSPIATFRPEIGRPVRQAFMLMAVMALAGCQQPTVVDNSGLGEGVGRLGDTEIARVDGTPIYLSDVERAAAARGLIAEGDALATDDTVFLTTLEELIDQRLLALDALRQGMDQENEAKRRLITARERILGNYRIESAISETVTESAVRELYDAQVQLANRGEERRVRQIVLGTRDEAVAAASRLEAGEDFAELVGELSIDEPTARASGDMGWLSRDMVTGALRTAVFETPLGERAGPIATQEGFHIIEVLDRRYPSTTPFEETREDLERFMTFETINTLVAGLRDDAEIQLTFGQAAVSEDTDVNNETPDMAESDVSDEGEQ